jgi:hypothetical protein
MHEIDLERLWGFRIWQLSLVCHEDDENCRHGFIRVLTRAHRQYQEMQTY